MYLELLAKCWQKWNVDGKWIQYHRAVVLPESLPKTPFMATSTRDPRTRTGRSWDQVVPDRTAPNIYEILDTDYPLRHDVGPWGQIERSSRFQMNGHDS